MLISFPDMGSCLYDFFFLFLGSNLFNSPFLIYCYMRFHVKPYIVLNLGVLSLGAKAMMVIINNISVIFIVLDNIYCFVLCVMSSICWPEDNWGRRQ